MFFKGFYPWSISYLQKTVMRHQITGQRNQLESTREKRERLQDAMQAFYVAKLNKETQESSGDSQTLDQAKAKL